MTPEEIERQKKEAALAAAVQAKPAPGIGPTPVADKVDAVNSSMPAGGSRLGAPGTATKQIIGVNESLVNGSPREVLTGSPAKTGAITETGFNVLTGGQAQGAGKKVGAFAQGIDQKTRDFFAKLDPTNTKIPRADGSALDASIGAVQGVAGKAGAMVSTLTKNPVQAQQVGAVNPGAATMTGQQAPIVADSIRGTTAEVGSAGGATFDPVAAARIAELERMQAAGISREDAEFRLGQSLLASQLQDQAAGVGPSLAQTQLARANDDAIKSQMALAASARGGNPVLAQRQAAQNVAALQQENAGKSAELALAEQLQARQQLGSVLDSARGQDIGVSTSQAQLVQEADKINKIQSDTAAIEQAKLTQGADIVNTTTGADVSKFNANQVLTQDMFNSEQDFKAAQADQAARLEADKATALNNINTDQFNAKARDEMARFKADANLRKDIANQAAALQAQGLTLDAITKTLGIEAQSLQAIMAVEQKKVSDEQGILSSEKTAQSNMGGSILSTVGTIVAMCFPAGQRVLMADGSEMPIEQVVAGDLLAGYNKVTGIHSFCTEASLVRVGNAIMTPLHAVKIGEHWQDAVEVGTPFKPLRERTVYNLSTVTGTMLVEGILCGDNDNDANDLNARECE